MNVNKINICSTSIKMFTYHFRDVLTLKVATVNYCSIYTYIYFINKYIYNIYIAYMCIIYIIFFSGKGRSIFYVTSVNIIQNLVALSIHDVTHCFLKNYLLTKSYKAYHSNTI